MQSTNLPKQSRRVAAVPWIMNSLNTHKENIRKEVALPHNTIHPPKPVPSRVLGVKPPRRLGIGTRQNTMLTIPYGALSKATRATMQPFRRSADTKSKAKSMSSLSILLRTQPNTRQATRGPQANAMSTLKVRCQFFLEVTWPDRRLTSSCMRQMGTSEKVRDALGQRFG